MGHKKTAVFIAPLLIFAGLMLTLENFQILHGVSCHWPVLLLILGCGFCLLFFQHQQKDVVMLWLGSFITFLGVFFYYLNFTTWADLSWLWPVFLGIVGMAFLAVGIAKRSSLYIYFAAVFILLFVILTLVFSVSTRLWPMSFVVFGAGLWMLEYLHHRTKG